MLRILHYPHPVLRYSSRAVTEIDDSLRGIIREMFELMYDARGVGLAANQVGLPFRFFVLNVSGDPEQKDQERVFINPEIIKRHSSVEEEEGCLSLPGVHGDVKRSKKIRVQAYDLRGELATHDADDLFSRAVQHEIDHLDGKLFIDHLSLLAKYGLKEKLRDFETRHKQSQASGELQSDDELVKILDAMTKPTADPFPAADATHA